MSLILTSAQNLSIRGHAESDYPDECCGVLIGEAIGAGNYVTMALPLSNDHEDGTARRFRIKPFDLLQAEKLARSRRQSVIGFYHSHPDVPAKPSEYDKEHAWETYSYLIVETIKGVAKSARSWRLDLDAGRFNEENVLVNDCVLETAAKSPQNVE